MRRHLLHLAIAFYLLALGWVTLNPLPQDPHENGVLRRVLALVADLPGSGWMTYDAVEFAANILLFVPMGLLLTLRLGRGRRWLVVTLGVGATFAIEFAQRFLPERVSDVRDLAANTLGTLIGIGVAALLARRDR